MVQILVGYTLDLLLGDPHFLYHPVRLIGRLITYLDTKLNKGSNQLKKMNGLILLILVSGFSFVIPMIILYAVSQVHTLLAVLLESLMIYQLFATRCLDVETRKVYNALKEGNIKDARRYISYLVSRDTDQMSEEDVIKAAIETIAENLGDGVVAPMIYIIMGGAPLGWYYKSVNTLDSMVGYKNEKYEDFGYYSAKWDDVLNYIPARITAIFILIAGWLLKYDLIEGIRILRRDKRNHASPNSAYPESAAAGLLGIQLGGKASYFGVTSTKPTMGDKCKVLNIDDLRKMKNLLYASSMVGMVVLMSLKWMII